MSIILDSDKNTVTLSGTLFQQDIALGFTITNINRTEVIFDARMAQSIPSPDDYSVNVFILNSTTVRVIRGGNFGTVVVHYQVMEYTVASGAIVDTGSVSFSVDTQNITIPTRTQANRYARVAITSTNSLYLEDNISTYEITSGSNLQVRGVAIAGSIIYWQTVYIPDQTVHNVIGLATGTSLNVDITSLGIVKENTFTIQSMRENGPGPVSLGIDTDGLKGAFISSDTNLEIYSFSLDSHDFVTQLVYRPKNIVDRDDNNYTVTPFVVALINTVIVAESYVNLPCPMGYLAPTDETSNNPQRFAHSSQLTSSTSVTLQRFINGDSTRLISEAVFLDGNPVDASPLNLIFSRHRRSI